eukprot:16851-Heterococcus_DN1.PRE.3
MFSSTRARRNCAPRNNVDMKRCTATLQLQHMLLLVLLMPLCAAPQTQSMQLKNSITKYTK